MFCTGLPSISALRDQCLCHNLRHYGNDPGVQHTHMVLCLTICRSVCRCTQPGQKVSGYSGDFCNNNANHFFHNDHTTTHTNQVWLRSWEWTLFSVPIYLARNRNSHVALFSTLVRSACYCANSNISGNSEAFLYGNECDYGLSSELFPQSDRY